MSEIRKILEELCVDVDNRKKSEFVFFHTLIDEKIKKIKSLILSGRPKKNKIKEEHGIDDALRIERNLTLDEYDNWIKTILK